MALPAALTAALAGAATVTSATRALAGPVGPATTKDGGAPPAKFPPPRTVDEILRDMIKAQGGAEAMAKHRSLHTKMTITFQGLGITGTAEHYAAAGDKALTITTIPSLASTREGSDGARSWSQDPINGLRVLTETEAEQARVESTWNADLRLKELFPGIEAKNEPADSGGAYLECLVLTPKSGPTMTDCFDPRTHLLVRQRGVRSSPQGNTPFVARVKEWRPVGDLKMPFVTEMQVGPLSFIGTVTSAELDVPIDPGLFALPAVPAADDAPVRDAAGGAGGASAKSKVGKAAKAAGGAKAPPTKNKTGAKDAARPTTAP